MIFKDNYKKALETISNHKVMVLSTSKNDIVTSRMISVVQIDGKFYFQTDCKMDKYNQITSNSNVSLCFDNVSIQGFCKEIGVPSANKKFCELYSKYFSSAYKLYSQLDNEVLFEITPTLVKIWSYESNQPYYEIYNVKEKSYIKKAYKI